MVRGQAGGPSAPAAAQHRPPIPAAGRPAAHAKRLDGSDGAEVRSVRPRGCCHARSVTQILNSGPPGAKQNIAVLGDGFADADQNAYNNKVKELLLDGVFGMDYFYEDRQAFNIFRVNLISKNSGVSQRVYDEMGTPSDRPTTRSSAPRSRTRRSATSTAARGRIAG